MEGAAPLDPSSGGTPTSMVAVPMLNTALGQRFSILGGTGTGTKMEASIHLRGKGFRSARTVAGESGRRDHQQRAGRFVGKSTASNTGGGGTAVHKQDVRGAAGIIRSGNAAMAVGEHSAVFPRQGLGSHFRRLGG